MAATFALPTAQPSPVLPPIYLSRKRKTGNVRVALNRGAPVSLHYELHGDGPRKILLIMGLNMSCQNWDLQTKFFGEMPEFQCLCFDNRGAGRSDSPSGLYSTSQMALDTYELMVSLGPEWRQAVHAVGISMGGMILQELALLAPPRTFASLTFISTNAGRAVPPVFAWTGVPAMMQVKDPLMRARRLVELLYSPEWRKQPPVNTYAKRARELGVVFKTNEDWAIDCILQRLSRTAPANPQGAVGQLSAVGFHFVSANRLDRIRKLGVETLVMTGTWDNLVRPSNSTYIAHHLKAPLIVLDGCGHAPINERVDEVNTHLLEHFNKAHARYAVEKTLWAAHLEEDHEDEVEADGYAFPGAVPASKGSSLPDIEGFSGVGEPAPALTVVHGMGEAEEVVADPDDADRRLAEMDMEEVERDERVEGDEEDEYRVDVGKNVGIMCI